MPLNDLWLDADDTEHGVRLFRREQAEASGRVLDRPSATGARTAYYEARPRTLGPRP